MTQPVKVAEKLLLTLKDSNGKEWYAVGIVSLEVMAVGDSKDRRLFADLAESGEVQVVAAKMVKE